MYTKNHTSGHLVALLLPPYWSWILKFWKKWKKMPRDIIFLYIYVYYKWRSYDICLLKYKVWQTEIFNILGHFLTLQPLDNLENQNFNIEKTPGDIIILHICTINDNHMMYGSWDMECNRQNFLSFWTVFCPFTPLWTQKIKIFKKVEKIPEDIIILQR